MNTSRAWHFIGVSFFIIVSLFCINIVEVNAQENGTHSFVELLTGKAKRDKEWYRVDAPPFYSWMWRHSPKLHPFNRVLWEIGTGFRYKYIDETHKINRSDSIFYSIIDSLNVIDYDNDTIYLFQYDNQYLLENRSHNVTKSDHWTFAPNRYPRRDSLVYRERDTMPFRMSWLPLYLQNALIEEDFDILSSMCKWYEYKTRYKHHSYGYIPPIHHVFHKIIIKDGKILERVKFEFEFDDVNWLYDDIYSISNMLKLRGNVFTPGDIDYKTRRWQIGEILDSVYKTAPYNKMLSQNREISKWERQKVIPLIDSLNLINYQNDTLYYELNYNKGIRGNTWANILTNTKRMFVYEAFDMVMWDTLTGFYRDNLHFVSHLNHHTEMQSRYVLYGMPRWGTASFLIRYIVYDWREIYYKSSTPFEIRYNKSLINESNGTNKKKKLRNGDSGVRIRVRITFKDGNVTDVITQMRFVYGNESM